MARARDKMFLQNFRFHAEATLAGSNFGSGTDPLVSQDDPDRSEAGFQTFSIPNYEIGSVEYRDGLRVHAVKQPGNVSVNTITAEQGVMKRDAKFLQWALRYFTGNEFYADIKVMQWPHQGKPGQQNRGLGGNYNPDNARWYQLYNCFPTSVVPASDLDAESEDVGIKEVEFEFESWELYVDPDTRVTATADTGLTGEA